MAKTTIIEAQSSNTSFEQNSSKGTLGKLAGVFADFKHGTRNSDRLYTEELWDNRVFGSEDVMEALNTKTLFGELDHPDGDRCETLAKNAAISITKLEKRPEEGVIYGEAEILDTPTGRIVKALADSGAQLGISSRGMGEEIMEDGQNIIDPETYDFITFDVVVTPANTKARVSLTESKHLNKLTESLKKEINECETENQLNQLNQVIENVACNEKEDLQKDIENRLEEFKEEKEEEKVQESLELSEEDKNIALKLFETKYIKMRAELKESIKASNELAEENTKLIEKLNKYEKLNKVRESKIKNLRETAFEMKTKNRRLEMKTKRLEESNSKESTNLLNKNREILSKLNKINSKKIEKLDKQYKDTIENLNEQINKEKTKFTNLVNENKKITESLESTKKIISEKDEKILKLESQIKSNSNKLTESKIQESKKITDLQRTINKLLEENKQLKEANDKFSDLAFTPLQGTVIRENTNELNLSFDDEDQALFNALLN